MNSANTRSSEDVPGAGGPGNDSGGDVLSVVADRLAGLDAGSGARMVVAEMLSDVLRAVTTTTAVRDPLPETAAGTAEESLAVLAGLDQLRGAIAAMEASWQVTTEDRIRAGDRDHGEPPRRQGRAAAHEIGLARRISPTASSMSLASARRLVTQMPGTWDALRTGRVTERQAATVATTLDGAREETCAQIDELISADPAGLDGMGCRRLQGRTREWIQQCEPELSRERAERAARARNVQMRPLAEGMARVSATLRAIDAAGLMQTLRTGAQSQRAAGTKDPAPALEADLLVDAVMNTREATADADPTTAAGEPAPATDDDPDPGTATAPPPVPRTTPGIEVGIVITDRALLAPENENETAHLDGYGPLPAHILTDTLQGTPPGTLATSTRPGKNADAGRASDASTSQSERECAPGSAHPDTTTGAFYRRLYTHPGTGELVAMDSRARTFPAGLARMIRWRDQTCRTPWCNAIIRQIDHAIAHHDDGPTSYDNGQGLCQRCNLIKEHGHWLLQPHQPTTPPPAPRPHHGWHWTSPHGATAASPTPPLIPPRRHRTGSDSRSPRQRRDPARAAPGVDDGT